VSHTGLPGGAGGGVGWVTQAPAMQTDPGAQGGLQGFVMMEQPETRRAKKKTKSPLRILPLLFLFHTFTLKNGVSTMLELTKKRRATNDGLKIRFIDLHLGNSLAQLPPSQGRDQGSVDGSLVGEIYLELLNESFCNVLLTGECAPGKQVLQPALHLLPVSPSADRTLSCHQCDGVPR